MLGAADRILAFLFLIKFLVLGQKNILVKLVVVEVFKHHRATLKLVHLIIFVLLEYLHFGKSIFGVSISYLVILSNFNAFL